MAATTHIPVGLSETEAVSLPSKLHDWLVTVDHKRLCILYIGTALFFCDALITRAYHNGLILLQCGQSTVRFMPPLMIEEADVDEAILLLDRSLTEVLASEPLH